MTGKQNIPVVDLRDFVAGDAYFVGPGHTPSIFAGTSLVEFSPTDRLNQTMEVVTRNMESSG
jgi:hypothetical protein